MSEAPRTCFTCRKIDSNKFYNVQDCETDNISYLDKLRVCINTDLVENEIMEMCWVCVKNLRISYKFRETVLHSQEVLKSEEDFVQVVVEELTSEEELIKSEEVEIYDEDEEECGEKAKKVKKLRKTGDVCFCEYCGGEFTKNWQLRQHINRVHSDSRRFICSYCGKEYKQAFHLKEHITVHTGEKNYPCPICEKKFPRMSSQKRHIRSHEAPPGLKTKRTPFLCTICGKSFPFSNGVQRHMRIHLGIKNYECSMCFRRFTQSTHLQVHMRTHTGEKPYICDTCGEKFSIRQCLMKHIENKHVRKMKKLHEEIDLGFC